MITRKWYNESFLAIVRKLLHLSNISNESYYNQKKLKVQINTYVCVSYGAIITKEKYIESLFDTIW